VDLLILGGTRFAGRHLADMAVDAGHRVTLFNRGETDRDAVPRAEHLRGDRDGGLAALSGRRWDVVADMCGYFPRVVGASARLLSGSVDHCIFVSSMSVYADPVPAGFDEDSPLATLQDETVEQIDGDTYGGLKVLCEREVYDAFGDRSLVIRPGLMVGPLDPTDRFTYWVRRVARGGDVLAPGSPDRPVQFIDARDVAAWMLRLAEEHRTGVLNATGPAGRLTMGEVLEECRRASGSDARFTWIPDDFLLEAGVAPWMEVPLWIPEAEAGGMLQADLGRPLRAGLTFRPLAETVADTLAWDRGRDQAQPMGAGLDPGREADILARRRTPV